MSLAVKSKTKDVVKCLVVDGGELKSRRHLNVRGKSATLPSITGILHYSCASLFEFFHLLSTLLFIRRNKHVRNKENSNINLLTYYSLPSQININELGSHKLCV